MSKKKQIIITLIIGSVVLAAYAIILRLCGIDDAKTLIMDSERMTTIAAWAFTIWFAASAILLCWVLQSRKQRKQTKKVP